MNKTVLWVALLINLNSALALPFELNLIIAYLPAFLLFVQGFFKSIKVHLC